MEQVAAIVEKLKAEGVQRGQVLSIDAHSNGPRDEAIFSAHYSKALPGLGPLDDLTFDEQLHATNGWNGQYEHAARHVRNSIDRRENLVSITAVITKGGGASCMYVFYYKDASVAAGAGLTLEFVESRDADYDTAANNLIGQLKAAGAQSGQVVSIDVHNNGTSTNPRSSRLSTAPRCLGLGRWSSCSTARWTSRTGGPNTIIGRIVASRE